MTLLLVVAIVLTVLHLALVVFGMSNLERWIYAPNYIVGIACGFGGPLIYLFGKDETTTIIGFVLTLVSMPSFVLSGWLSYNYPQKGHLNLGGCTMKNQKGLSLIETMLILVIIGILAAIGWGIVQKQSKPRTVATTTERMVVNIEAPGLVTMHGTLTAIAMERLEDAGLGHPPNDYARQARLDSLQTELDRQVESFWGKDRVGRKMELILHQTPAQVYCATYPELEYCIEPR